MLPGVRVGVLARAWRFKLNSPRSGTISWDLWDKYISDFKYIKKTANEKSINSPSSTHRKVTGCNVCEL